MQPTIEDGEMITVAPVAPEAVKRGDILLYRGQQGSHASVLIHRVVGITRSQPVRIFRLRGDASVS
jgi:signal peptidase I